MAFRHCSLPAIYRTSEVNPPPIWHCLRRKSQMSFKRKIVNLTLVGTVALAMCLTGCGKRTLAEAPIDPAASEEPAASAPVDPDPAPVASPSTPAYEPAPIAAGSLVVSGITKDKVGIIGFRKVEVKGQVVNTGTTPLSG